MPFVKLDCGIIHSSLWAEDSDTKICWITMLLLADATGFVRAAASAIAREAGIPADVARRALELFAGPDDESRTPDNQGKRIEKIDGGFRILNYEKYRERDYTNAERQKRYRAKRNTVTAVTSRVTTVTRNGASRMQKQKQIKKKEASDKPMPTVDDWLKELEADPTYTGIPIRTVYGKMLNWCKLRHLQPTQRRFINWLNKEEKPLPTTAAARVTYKRNYLPPAREPTPEEIAKSREIARRESLAFKQRMNGGDLMAERDTDSPKPTQPQPPPGK
jgi:hypothetical protein